MIAYLLAIVLVVPFIFSKEEKKTSPQTQINESLQPKIVEVKENE